jgi:hypothetical protein
VCASHDVGQRGFCSVCADELLSDVKQRSRARSASDAPEEARPSVAEVPRAALVLAVLALTDKVEGWFDERVAKEAFERRSPDEIAAWRRRAGIVVRET